MIKYNSKNKRNKQFTNDKVVINSNSFVFKKNILFLISIAFVFSMIVYVVRLNSLTESLASGVAFNQDILRPQKGQIFMQNMALKNYKPLTFSNYSTKIIVNPKNLNQLLINKKFSKEEISAVVASTLNLTLTEVKQRIEISLANTEISYFVLFTNVNTETASVIKNILDTTLLRSSDYFKYNIQNWLSYEDIETRSYPESNLASNVIGYSSESYWANEDLIKEKRCLGLLENNKKAQANGYKIGLAGLEAKYCSELNGLNGLRTVKDSVKGKDLILTIDYNLQKQAEKITNSIITENTNNKGAPKNATTIIVEVNNPDQSKNGRVLAMASSPYFNPNEYSKDYETKPTSFLNYATDVPYESGSVLKPIMVSTLLNEYETAKKENPNLKCEEDKRLCVNYNYKFKDTCGGKRYSSENILIKNYNNNCFPGDNGLKEILRDSINTGIAELGQNIKTEVLRDYYLNKFNFGKATSLGLFNESSGVVKSMNENNGYNINNAYFGFGQGFTNTPIQLIQSYIPIVSEGQNFPVSIIESDKLNKPTPTIYANVANTVKNYMASTSSEGYRGTGAKMELNGYGNGTKTGTAQIARSDTILDELGKPKLDQNGKELKVWCGYDCNSEKGLYEHTLIGFAPVSKPRILVLTKVSEARPYESTLTSANQILRKPWLEITQYALEYLEIFKEY
jgi:cell division protein FtsI/penicillin-binding protein 2